MKSIEQLLEESSPAFLRLQLADMNAITISKEERRNIEMYLLETASLIRYMQAKEAKVQS